MNAFRFQLFIILALIVALSACVPATEQAQTKADQKKALEAHVTLGLTYLRNDNREASRRNFEKALEINPNSPEALNGIALLYQLTGENELAEQSFKKAIAKKTSFSLARVNYGQYLFQQQRYPEAYKEFEKASQDISFANRDVALTYLGQTALRMDNVVKAKASFLHAVNLNNKFAPPLIELGELLFAEENYAESKAYLDRYTAIAGRTAKSLWLGIRIERVFGNKDKEASYALALKNLHPYSKEYLEYKQVFE